MNHTAIFTVLFIAALGTFCVLAWRRLSLISLGKPENRFDRLSLRTWDMLLYAFGQRRVVARPFGINHFVIFWSFMILLVANGEFMVKGVFPGVSLAILPAPLYHVLQLAFDLVSLLTLAAIVVAFGRRLLFPPDYLSTSYTSARSGQALVILSFIGLLMLAWFGMNATQIALGNDPAA